MTGLFGKSGSWFYFVARGVDDRPVESSNDPKSMSREVTFPEDCTDLRTMRIVVRSLARKVFRRSQKHGFAGKGVNLKVKFADFRTITRSNAQSVPVSDGEELGDLAVELLAKSGAGRNPVRLLGVGLSSLQPVSAPVFEQLILPLKEKQP